MPTITFSGGTATEGFDYGEWNVSMLMLIVSTTFSTSHSATHVTYNEPTLGTLTAFGTFSNYNAAGDPQSGTVTGLTHTTTFGSPGAPRTISITGLSISVPTLFNWIVTDNALAFETALFGGADTFNGANNGERIFGYGGDDIIHGNDGDDTLIGSVGNDTLNGGAGWDTLESAASSEGNDTLNGGDGDDTIFSSGVDTIDGGDGTDLVHVTLTATVNLSTADLAAPGGFTTPNGTTIQNVEVYSLTGGAGDDTFTILSAGVSGSTFNGGGGLDTVISDQSASSANLTLGAHFMGWRVIAERFLITTGAGNDNLTGGSGDDVLNAGAGNDTINGAAGANTINGGEGDDYIHSNGVAEQIDGGNGRDTVVLSRTSGDFSLSIAALASGVTLSDNTSLINLEGVSLTTGAGNDTFDATGYTSESSFFAGAGTDRLIYDHSGQSLGVQIHATQGQFGNGLALFTFSGVEEFHLTGGSGADTFFAGAGDDILIGGAGNDGMSGAQGDDTIFGGDGADAITGGGGANMLFGEGGDDRLTTDSVTDIVDGGAGTDRVVLNRTSAPGGTFDLATVFSGTFSDGTVISNVETFELNLSSGGDDTILLSVIYGADNLLHAGNGGNDHLIVDFSAYASTVGIGIFDSSGRNFSLSAGGASMTAWEIDRLTFSGGSAMDFITGSVGNDVLSGNGGDDSISGRAGVNVLNGGAGDDTLLGNATDTFDGGDGIDEVRIELAPASSVGINYSAAAMASSAGQVLADGGVIRNVESIDMDAGDGNDSMVFIGLIGANRFIGHDGFDRLTVDLSATTAALGGFVTTVTGPDFSLTYHVDHFTLLCGSGDDSLQTGASIDLISGNDGNDSLNGWNGNDTLNGGNGNDSLFGGDGADTMIGGAGDDTYTVDNAGDITSETSPADGIDTVRSSITRALGANLEHLQLTSSAAISGFGNALDNQITGNTAANSLNGFDGNDILNGGGGADAMFGGNGDDAYVVDNAGDVTSEVSALGGVDTVFSSVSRNLTAHIENLTLTGAASITGAGNSLNNVMTGNSGANTLYGFAGDDRLDGGASADTLFGADGDDTYIVDNVSDITVEGSLTGGVDTVESSISRNLNANFENLILTGTAQFGYGNILDNVMTGNAAANGLYGFDGDDRLDGAGGVDQMFGANGDDTYVVDNAGDVTSEVSALGGTDTVESSVTRNLTAHLENLVLTGADAITGAGNALANVIIGNSGANTLFGLDGADTLDGGLGADTLQGGLHADTYVFSSELGGGNIDAINGFNVADDTIALDGAIFGLAAGALDASAFHIGAAATDVAHRIIYDSAAGALYFDADGDGAGAAIQFATLAVGLALTHNDFIVN